ncbi:SPOR domain-containing protein [Tsuneonella sp. HG222]
MSYTVAGQPQGAAGAPLPASASIAPSVQGGGGVGPAGDYPVTVGEPYRIGTTLYTPADKLNYDEVGYIAADTGAGVTVAHHTLPVPSYVEITALDSGRTILARVERRGPMTSESLVALSPMALEVLAATAGTPVRVRRVNPQEFDRAKLRSGQSAAARMDTPETLLTVLKRKLPDGGLQKPAPVQAQAQAQALPKAVPSVAVPPSTVSRELPQVAAAPAQVQRPAVAALPRPSLPPLGSPAQPYRAPTVVATLPAQPATIPVARGAAPVAAPVAAAPVARPTVQTPPQQTAVRAASAASGAYVVQVAALSSLQRAQSLAGTIGGQVSKTGSLYRVRTGPFTSRGQAEASLAKVRAAGYSEARIFTNG